MNEFLSVLEHIGGGSAETVNDEGMEEKADCDSIDELTEQDEKEVVEIVEDFIVMKNKEVLKRNLETIVRENVQLNKRVKVLETKVKSATEGRNAGMTFQIDTEGAEESQVRISVYPGIILIFLLFSVV